MIELIQAVAMLCQIHTGVDTRAEIDMLLIRQRQCQAAILKCTDKSIRKIYDCAADVGIK